MVTRYAVIEHWHRNRSQTSGKRPLTHTVLPATGRTESWYQTDPSFATVLSMPTCLQQPTTKTQPADRIPLHSSLTADHAWIHMPFWKFVLNFWLKSLCTSPRFLLHYLKRKKKKKNSVAWISLFLLCCYFTINKRKAKGVFKFNYGIKTLTKQ